MESGQIVQYLPILLLLGAALGLTIMMLAASHFLGVKGKRPPIKDSPYECGVLPIGKGHSRFAVKFYLVAMLFILFDVEVVFLYPWAVVYREMLATHANLILGSMVSFIAILLVGYIYAVKKEAFSWKD